MRRALAAAGRRAVEVEVVALAAPRPPDAHACRQFVRRALGPPGADVALAAVAVPDDDPDRLARAAAEVLAAPDHGGDWNVAVAVGLGSDGSAVALCLERSGR